MSSKSAVKLVVPATARRALPVGRDPHRLEERAQGRRLLPRRPAAHARRLPDRAADPRRRSSAPRWSAIVVLMRGELGTPTARRSSSRCSPTTARSTCSPRRASSCSPRATSGSSSACPVFLRTELGWSFWQVGTLPRGLGDRLRHRPGRRRRALMAAQDPDGRDRGVAGVRARGLPGRRSRSRSAPTSTRRSSSSVGLIAFGVVFALNSAVHSYLILAYAEGDKVAMNVGFYYMANAGGRLAGTVLSGALYQWQGLEACLWASASSCSPPARCRCCCRGLSVVPRRAPQAPRSHTPTRLRNETRLPALSRAVTVIRNGPAAAVAMRSGAAAARALAVAPASRAPTRCRRRRCGR